jgi:hypothetical protein
LHERSCRLKGFRLQATTTLDAAHAMEVSERVRAAADDALYRATSGDRSQGQLGPLPGAGRS